MLVIYKAEFPNGKVYMIKMIKIYLIYSLIKKCIL